MKTIADLKRGLRAVRQMTFENPLEITQADAAYLLGALEDAHVRYDVLLMIIATVPEAWNRLDRIKALHPELVFDAPAVWGK